MNYFTFVTIIYPPGFEPGSLVKKTSMLLLHHGNFK